MGTQSRVHVVAAVLVDDHGRVLLAERPASAHLGGYWEFPGGKVEQGEATWHALQREIREELGIELLQAHPLIRISHDYSEHPVLLDVWRATKWQGVPHGREGQVVEWVDGEVLPARTMPPADKPVLTALSLPPAYLVTPEPDIETGEFVRRLAGVLGAGVSLVQLRAKQMTLEALRPLCLEMRTLFKDYNAKWVINGPEEWALALGADGVHLSAQRLLSLRERPLPDSYLVGASCHDKEELAHAERIRADFAVLGPVNPTGSHPSASSLGWRGFEALVASAGLPVYALGGLQLADLDSAWHHGGQGIAAIRGLWRSTEELRRAIHDVGSATGLGATANAFAKTTTPG
ncbi:MAG: Nudix family hydrolase [Gammaproteobacteria bacterium]|nr:MAG: Nudix family hydrolase [Gammaproteobacteria bacterium]